MDLLFDRDNAPGFADAAFFKGGAGFGRGFFATTAVPLFGAAAVADAGKDGASIFGAEASPTDIAAKRSYSIPNDVAAKTK